MLTDDFYEEAKGDLIMKMCRLASRKDLNYARIEAIGELLEFIGDLEITHAVEHALQTNERNQV